MNIDIRHIAELAKLELNDEEIAQFTPEIEAILTYTRLLATQNLEEIEPTAHARLTYNVFRDDVETPTLPTDSVLQNAPHVLADEYFKVPAVIALDQ